MQIKEEASAVRLVLCFARSGHIFKRCQNNQCEVSTTHDGAWTVEVSIRKGYHAEAIVLSCRSNVVEQVDRQWICQMARSRTNELLRIKQWHS